MTLDLVSFLAGAWLMSALGTLAFIREAARNMKGHKDNGHDA